MMGKMRMFTSMIKSPALLASLMAACAVIIPAPASAATPIKYVALGDSAVAGPLVMPQVDMGCTRSSKNWPSLLAASLGATLTDVSCSGAKTDDVLKGYTANFKPAQLGALTSDTNLVTITIGANDIDTASAFLACANPFMDSSSPTCASTLVTANAKIAQVGQKVATILQEVRRRSPAASVYFVSYGSYFIPGGCWNPSRNPLAGADSDRIEKTWDLLHDTLKATVQANGVNYIDLRTPSQSHGVCAAAAERWMEGMIPGTLATPYHQNAQGHAADAALLLQAISTAP